MFFIISFGFLITILFVVKSVAINDTKSKMIKINPICKNPNRLNAIINPLFFKFKLMNMTNIPQAQIEMMKLIADIYKLSKKNILKIPCLDNPSDLKIPISFFRFSMLITI